MPETFTQLVDEKHFHPFSPRADEVHIEDIARSLSNLCRFGGHVRAFYSVAEHSIHVSRLVEPEYALDGLLHDAAEAYVGDIMSPVKDCTYFASFGLSPNPSCVRAEAMEFEILDKIADALMWRRCLYSSYVGNVDPMDKRLTAHEARMLQGGVKGWGEPYESAEPLELALECWPSGAAAEPFLMRFWELMG